MLLTILTWIIDTLVTPWFNLWDRAGIIPWVIGGFILSLVFTLLGAAESAALSDIRSHHRDDRRR